jgi:hypothetical protein
MDFQQNALMIFDGNNWVEVKPEQPDTIEALFAMPGHCWKTVEELRERVEMDVNRKLPRNNPGTPWCHAYWRLVDREIDKASPITVTLPAANSFPVGAQITITNNGDSPLRAAQPPMEVWGNPNPKSLRAELDAVTRERDALRAMLNRVSSARAGTQPELLADWPDDE